VAAEVPVSMSGGSGASMAIALGETVIGLTNVLEEDSPDAVIILGDRGEALAGALSAVHLNIPVVHIHGGERSGTIDDSLRHAISKISHFHFVATKEAQERLCKMGENPDHVYKTGAPGLDAIVRTSLRTKEDVCSQYKVDPSVNYYVLVFHPVVQELHEASAQALEVLQAIEDMKTHCLVLLPNADAGGNDIKNSIESFESSLLSIHSHIPRTDFLSLVHHAAAIVGNSSCGIIESASLSTPCVNIGTRQHARARNNNVIDAPCSTPEIVKALQKTEDMQGKQWDNLYGNGDSSQHVVDLLCSISLHKSILEKSNVY